MSPNRRGRSIGGYAGAIPQPRYFAGICWRTGQAGGQLPKIEPKDPIDPVSGGSTTEAEATVTVTSRW